MNIIETKNLNYQFNKKEKILKNINLQVPDESVYGFLGPNGAGKTTTLRLLLGLLKAQEGSIQIFGKDLNKNRIEILKNVGSLIEQPSLYGHLTGKENLDVYRHIFALSSSRVAEILALVGLSSAANKKAKSYSLGMKQRLSIGVALLHNPKLLILDEPTNGLDPNGIIEMRELIKKLNTELGVTIIVSSHLLTEIEKVVTHIGIINYGEMLFQGSLEELNKLKNKQASLIINCNNIDAAMQLPAIIKNKASLQNGKIIIANASNQITAEIITQLVNNNLQVYEASVQGFDLEKIFLQITNNQN